MKNYIVRVYRVRHNDIDSVSGFIEDIESGQKEPFHNISKLQSLLAYSIMRGQLELDELVPQESVTREKIVVAG
jgi:hypothetical protein